MKKTDNIFSIIWAGFMVIFLIMAYFSWQSVGTKLPRYVYEAPSTMGILANGTDTLKVMENISKTHDNTVEQLEKSIQREATTMTVLNGVSAFFCLLGFCAQNGHNNQSPEKNQ